MEEERRYYYHPGSNFFTFAGVILPAVSITVEATTHICADTFFDPIPTIWHLLLVIVVPLAQLQVWFAIRRVAADPLLRLSSFAVIPEGTCLNWAGQMIWIDAPCSGIKMLWVGLFLTFVTLCLYELPLLKTLLLLPLIGVVIMAANVFRAVALFYLEAGVLSMPAWGHEYAGVIAFVLEAAAIISIVLLLRRRNVCVVATT